MFKIYMHLLFSFFYNKGSVIELIYITKTILTMGKKWTDRTKILYEKKKELGIKKLTIANCKQYPNNPFQLVFDGKHVGFFKTWHDAFEIIDEILEKGIEKVREENRRVLKKILSENGKLLCYRCSIYKDSSMFKWGHKYCTDCAHDQKNITII